MVSVCYFCLHRECQEGDLDHICIAFDRTRAELCAFSRNPQANTLPYTCGKFVHCTENSDPALQKVAHLQKNRRIHAPLRFTMRQVLADEAPLGRTYI